MVDSIPILRPRDKSGTREASLSDVAYGQLEELIVTLKLEPGALLSEASLVTRLEIGRTPVREALQRLEREGLVSVFPRRGVLVAEIDIKRQLKMLDLRREVERLMARLACRFTSDEECREFARLAVDMNQTAYNNDDIAFMRLDRELNQLLSRKARNEFAAKAISLTQGLSRRFWYLHYKHAADLPLCARLHARQAQTISERNSERAAQATDDLIDYVETFTRATLDA